MSFVCPQMRVGALPRGRGAVVVRAQYDDRPPAGQDTGRAYGGNKRAQDGASSGLRRRALARLQGLLPSQWNQDNTLETGLEQVPARLMPGQQAEYGLANVNGQGTSLAQRTMITIRFQVKAEAALAPTTT